ncbi:tRNA lysidine(34) synthetase TilS [Sulfuricurvum sp. IAE1]|uniref:tRNA lysidine(34) synthetase TilS n=1 Tax=Sulfuricurvum sp. IAE1 TaxID=2546102 RepID=UPI0010509F30|nr:tRNA lysidine(34) synthetase TilS [Sulfuricurvum sp. IAE1]TDA62784.1 tRNA lysidine(34) synthetase TilS [Sulfuricurvum sp. IAE1]
MRDLLHLELLKEGKSLLAFSGGADSTALFHLLLDARIDFDIAHVNYHTRSASDTEEENAITLAKRYNKRCYTFSCRLGGTNFEHRAREERYRFFSHLVEKHGYTYVLTAHQLNDRLEWLMMQLCRGAGLPELLGIRSSERRGNIHLVRPLLEWDRESIESYLRDRNIPFSLDESNADERYTRNVFRHRFSAPMMREYRDAIRRSFRYLEEDTDEILEPMAFENIGSLFYASAPARTRSLVSGVDACIKSLGYVMKSGEKENLKKNRVNVIGRRYVVCTDDGYTFIAPYCSGIVMDKGFKEECRRLGVEPKLRGYLYGDSEAWEAMRRLKGVPVPLRSD